MRSSALSLLGSVLFLSAVSHAQSCDAIQYEIDCVSDACTWVNGLCRCASEVKLDILFNVDTSGSIGYNGFQTQRDFLRDLVTQGINNGSNIGFFMFSTTVNESRGLQQWDEDELLNYVNGLYWSAGFTNTGGVIEASLAEFERTYDAERQQVLMMVTDGNPCLRGNCPFSVCGYASQLKAAGIRVIIIGVGDGLTSAYVSCLCQDDDDYIPVASFSDDDFDSIMGTLSGIVCPVAKEAKVTEVKAEKKMDGWNERWSRFVEIYNSGGEFNVNDIELSGLVNMAHGDGPDVTVAQGQYLVFYDAADDSFGGDSTVSCHLCGATCTLDECVDAGDTTSDTYCWCENSVYVACRNSAEQCPGSLPEGNSDAAISACSVCYFDDTMDRSSWNIALRDSAALIDDVTYDASTWITTWDGYAYELAAKGFDNDKGSSWGQSCSVLGTPGSDPSANCDAECTDEDGCGGGGTCNSQTRICDCDDGYYPQCTSSTSCTTCLEVPEVADCNVTWTKNGTDRYAAFRWTAAERDADTKYKLTYFAGSKNGGTSSVSTYDVLYNTADYWSGNTTFGGFVETAIDVCTNTTGTSICVTYYSTQTACEVRTQSPTTSPTPAPTPLPSSSPTAEPTMSPVWECPTFWWSNDDVCNPDQCNCAGDKPDKCCLSDPVFAAALYDANRSHDGSFECKLDSELTFPTKRAQGVEEAGLSNGYLLEVREHHFLIDIDPDGYPHTMDIHWRLDFDIVSCSYSEDSGTANATTCDSDDPAHAGLAVDPLEGHLTVWGEDDVLNASVSFTVSQLSCDDAEEITDNATNGTVGRRRSRRLLEDDTSCFEGTAVYGSLVIVNATSRQQPDCYDGRIYPMRVPVWFNYAAAFVTPPSDTSEIPPWLWWLIAALVVFLGVLAVLVYWYWFKNKRTGAALNAKQIEIDAEVEINENGWQSGLDPNAVGFNPLATGFNPNAAAGAADPNAPLNAGGGGQDFVRPNVERTVFREQYGPNAGNMR